MHSKAQRKKPLRPNHYIFQEGKKSSNLYWISEFFLRWWKLETFFSCQMIISRKLRSKNSGKVDEKLCCTCPYGKEHNPTSTIGYTFEKEKPKSTYEYRHRYSDDYYIEWIGSFGHSNFDEMVSDDSRGMLVKYRIH